MKKKLLTTAITITTLAIATASSPFAGGLPVPATLSDEQINAAATSIFGYTMPEWSKRIELQGTWSGENPTWSILTVQPLWQTEDKRSTFFTQLSALNYDQFGESRTTTNFGLGYRRLVLDDTMFVGVNSFYDHEWDYNHQRASIGAEARSAAFEINTNYYTALSDRKSVNDSGTTTERALGGWDAEAGVQIPYMPWAQVFAKTYKWYGEEGSDIYGRTYSLRAKPLQWLEVEAGRDNDGANGVGTFIRTAIKMDFDEPTKTAKLFDTKPFAFGESMADKTLDHVRRTNKIVTERTTTTSGGGGGTLTVSVSRGN